MLQMMTFSMKCQDCAVVFIEIEGTRITAAYQDLVGILLANGYTVEVTPLHNNTRLQVVIKESEDEINE